MINAEKAWGFLRVKKTKQETSTTVICILGIFLKESALLSVHSVSS